MAEKLFDNSFNSTELTKINIEPHKVFAYDEDELHQHRLTVQEYMNSKNYDDYIFIKYTRKRQINVTAANKIFDDISTKFRGLLSLTELYSLMSTHFEIDYCELYNLFTTAIQTALKRELQESMNFSDRELFSTKANDGMYMPVF